MSVSCPSGVASKLKRTLLAVFIAEGGQECIKDKQEGLMGCFNQTGVEQPNLASFDPSALSNFTLSFDVSLYIILGLAMLA